MHTSCFCLFVTAVPQSNHCAVHRKWVQRHHEPRDSMKWPPEPPFLQSDLKTNQNHPLPHATFPNSVSTSRIMIFKKKYLAFTFIKILFFKSQHDIKVLIILKQLVLKSLLLSRLRKTVYLQRKNNFNWE